MPHDLSDAILARISNFAVGLVIREPGQGSRVLGSGVLASIEGRRGILTCGHVADVYGKLPEIGVMHFVAGGQQRRMIQLAETQTIIIESSDSFRDTKEVFDLAFTWLPPDVASSLEANGVYLNIEKNRTKMESMAATRDKHIDAMLGLVEEFSGKPFREGMELISPMRAVLHSGNLCAQENGLLTMNAMEYNLSELPKSFGGMSGGGLWRVYVQENEEESSIVATVLCGIASWQVDGRKIACQGWDRIDQALVAKVRENFHV